jgi:hypothetical protein
MVDVSFELRGKRLALEDMDAVERQALETVAHRVAEALASVTCAVHGSRPEVIVRGDDVRHLEFRVHGCCAPLIDQAMDRLREPAPTDWWLRDRIPTDW